MDRLTAVYDAVKKCHERQLLALTTSGGVRAGVRACQCACVGWTGEREGGGGGGNDSVLTLLMARVPGQACASCAEAAPS